MHSIEVTGAEYEPDNSASIQNDSVQNDLDDDFTFEDDLIEKESMSSVLQDSVLNEVWYIKLLGKY